MNEQGTLSVVATPIGNLEDITLRALRVLKEADYILSEDTRVTKKLLSHYQIDTPTKRYDAHASDRTHDAIITDLEAGKHAALVTDAGTPGISDPGVLLVQKARIAGVRIDAIPGPSALTAALSIAGITGNQFVFLGFVPQKKGRQTFFSELSSYEMSVVFFESTHRIMKTLEALAGLSADHMVIIGRELTKMHEEVVTGTATEVLAYFTQHVDHQRGEFVVIVQ
ncbi:MAG: 16S rRNA (cytidine(1402)-2'-O)-methyltransferase [Candidatus Paceibacterota bacterium]